MEIILAVYNFDHISWEVRKKIVIIWEAILWCHYQIWSIVRYWWEKNSAIALEPLPYSVNTCVFEMMCSFGPRLFMKFLVIFEKWKSTCPLIVRHYVCQRIQRSVHFLFHLLSVVLPRTAHAHRNMSSASIKECSIEKKQRSH